MDNQETRVEKIPKRPGCLVLASQSRSTWVGAVVALVLGTATGLSLRSVFTDPPTVVLKSRILSPVVYHDETLHFLIDRASGDPPNCPGNITREYAGQTIVDGELIPDLWRPGPVGTAIVRPGIRKYAVHVPLADKMPFGHWEFTGVTTFYCPFWQGGTQKFEVRGVKFEYRDRPPSKSIVVDTNG